MLRDLTLNISVSADETAEASAFMPYDGEKEKNIILCGSDGRCEYISFCKNV